MALENTTYSLRTGTVEHSGFVADADLRRNRLSQAITCQLLVLFEALLVGVAALITLGNFIPANLDILTADAIYIATMIVFLSALLTGGAGYDKFSSRLALFPGATIASMSAVFAAPDSRAPIKPVQPLLRSDNFRLRVRSQDAYQLTEGVAITPWIPDSSGCGGGDES